MKENLVREKGWVLLRKLFLVAKKDGRIDFDEQRILKATDFNVMNLLAHVKEAWKNKRLNEKEKKQITFLIKKIQDDAVTLAMYDDIISDQEQEMLDIIADMMIDFMRMS